MSSLLRRGVPRRPRRVRIRTAVIVASGVVALVGSLVLARTDTMKWFDLGDDTASAQDSGLRMLEAEGETPAERVVTELAAWAKPPGWKTSKPKGAVSDPFGLTCLDGPLAWSTARARTLSGVDGDGQVAVIAYPAGGGGAAFAQVAAAASMCTGGSDTVAGAVPDEDAETTPGATPDAGENAGASRSDEGLFGIESIGYRKGSSAVQVMRRGDVLAVVSSAPANRMPGEEWLTALDDRLSRLLGDDCTRVDAPATEALRNPFIDPEAFTGNVVMDPVPFPDVDLTRADDVATDPVVPLNIAPPVLPVAGERPAPLDPPASDLPELPLEVALPEAPAPPAAPDLDGSAARAVADPDGPGCGWAFTGETAPTFDEAQAAVDAKKAHDGEVERLVDDAVAFEQGKVNFYRAWVTHLAAVSEYEKYVSDLETIGEQWQVVLDARALFTTEFEKYRVSQQAFDTFTTERAAAQITYDEALLTCLDPANWLLPDAACPAQPDPILSRPAPTVLPQPTPSAEAQLPSGWEPPAPVAEPEDEPEQD